MYIIIVGCGRVGSELANLLSQEGHNVVVIDRNPQAFLRLGATFNGLTLVGNGFDLELLREAGIEKADAFCALTNGDNTNLVCAQVAKKIFKVPKVIARVYDPARAHIYHLLGLDVISGTLLFASMIRDKIIETKFSSYLIESKDVGVLEIEINQGLEGKKVKDINIEEELMVVAIKKMSGVVLPKEEMVLEKGDIVLALVKTEKLAHIKEKFKI
ncbi:MAG: TrkA family potassium uptake protein [Candidatus Omnitrophica bacterium]|nr:TrkA family potassium uptake protein [Candidatus Omnitrophota bacterium]